jgi:hypothetical protein
MHLMWVIQAHHIDTDYYDRFFGPGAYGPVHATHMANWHLPALGPSCVSPPPRLKSE